MHHLRYENLESYDFSTWKIPHGDSTSTTYVTNHLRYDSEPSGGMFHTGFNQNPLSGTARSSGFTLGVSFGYISAERRHLWCPFSSQRACLRRYGFYINLRRPLPSFEREQDLLALAPAKRVNAFSGFLAAKRNKYMHALNGNIVWFSRRTPPPRNYLWSQSVYLSNGMCLFRYSFFGKDSLWIFACRRGSSFEMETTRRESPTLYGVVCKAVASRGGGPGDRWHLVKSHDHMWHRRGNAPHTYVTDHLRYDVPSGYQHREAHGGASKRGIRSKEAYDRRKEAWKSSRLLGRRDFRKWKSEIKDSTMRVHGGANPQPPIHPRPTYVKRFRKFQARLPINSQRIQLHNT